MDDYQCNEARQVSPLNVRNTEDKSVQRKLDNSEGNKWIGDFARDAKREQGERKKNLCPKIVTMTGARRSQPREKEDRRNKQCDN